MCDIEIKYEIEISKDNYKILKIYKDNKNVYIGSKYNMKREIDSFLGKYIKVDEKSVLLVYGFGAGEHIKLLRKKFVDNEIIVFEPNILLRKYTDELDWVRSDDKLIITSANTEEIYSILKKYINEFNVDFVKSMYFSNYDKIFPYSMDKLTKIIQNFLVDLKLSSNTAKKNSNKKMTNLFENIKYIINGVPADIYSNKYKNKPAVIVSAGPSLEKNIELLKKIDNSIAIISGERTLRSLIDLEISPDLLVAVDYNNICYDLCKDYIENLNKPLLFSENTNSHVVANHKGEKLFYTNNKFINNIAGHEIKKIEDGGSVAHVMTSYAIMLGCNPIIFIGQDLAYTDDKSHASICQNRDGKIGFKELKNDKQDIYVKDINGEQVRTSLVLDSFRRFLEKIIEDNPKINFINATEGGAKIKGTIEMSLEEAIDKYKVEKFNMFEKMNYEVDMRENAIKYLKLTQKTCKDIIGSYNNTKILLGELKRYSSINDINRVNEILTKLNRIDNKVNEKYKDIYLADSLIYPIIYESMTSKSINSELSFKEKIDSIYDENMRFYDSISKELNYVLEKIDYILNEI